MPDAPTTTKVPTFCPLCVSRCGATATVADGEFVALGPDPTHPTGQALCVKGKAAPEIVRPPRPAAAPAEAHPTRKATADPGWQRISWDEALDTVAERLRALARDHGPESVVFSSVVAVDVGDVDSVDWIQRLQRAFGSPNCASYMELCGWGRYLASLYTYGASVPGAVHARSRRAPGASCSGATTRRSRGSPTRRRTTAALRRGARLVVVDPRRAGLATKADQWLRVRPGTDAALALAITHVMIERGWYDDDVRPPLDQRAAARPHRHRPLAARRDLVPDGDPASLRRVGRGRRGRPSSYDPARARTDVDEPEPRAVRGPRGPDDRRPGRLPARRSTSSRDGCREMAPAVAEEITGVPPPRSSAPHARCGSTAPSRSTRGAGSSSTATRPRSSARSTSCTRSPVPRRPRRQRAVHRRCRPTRSTARSCSPRRSAAKAIGLWPSGPLGPPASGSSPARTSTPRRSTAVRTGRAGW